MTDTVADVVLARLREWGVNQVFGYPGDGINGLLAAPCTCPAAATSGPRRSNGAARRRHDAG